MLELIIPPGLVCGIDEAGRGPLAGPVVAAAVILDPRRPIPGLNDSHLHVIRAGLYYNMELRWDGVPSLADAMRMLKEQAQHTPPPH